MQDLQAFLVGVGAALNAAGEPVYSVEERLIRVARAQGARSARISAFPTFLMVSVGRGEPATLELTGSLAGAPRLDQIAMLDQLVHRAEHGTISVAEGLKTLDVIRDLGPRFGPAQTVAGYAVLAFGLCLILHPSPSEAVAAAGLGALVGVLRSLGRDGSPLQVLMPVIAAFSVSALAALAVKHGLTGPGLRAMVAALVVFLPGATLTTAVLELAAGQMVSGASRLVSGAVQLALLTFGIVAGVEAVGESSTSVFADSPVLLGDWAPWFGVLVFAVGVMVANSAPPKAFAGLVIVLYAAWLGQVAGNALFGGYVSALVGATFMTPVAFWVSRMPSAMPPHASFLPGFWLLVPGALGLIGLAQLAGDAAVTGSQELVNTVASLFAVAIGVLCGTLLMAWASAVRRAMGHPSGQHPRHPMIRVVTSRSGARGSSGSDDDPRPR